VSLEVKREVVDAFLQNKDATMDMMVWSGGCRSWYVLHFSASFSELWCPMLKFDLTRWYKNGTLAGPIIGPWCGST
jgi:hypothetical protein